jgi:hypothetical protein
VGGVGRGAEQTSRPDGATMKLRFAISLLSIVAGTFPANAIDVAVCGSSEGRAFYPSAALRANEPGEWVDDPISSGRITLSMTATEVFDVLIADATGAVFSAKQDGARVFRVGQNEEAISILVVYAEVIETYTFLHSSGGPEVIWTSNKHSTPILKAGAYRAKCTYINLPK